MKWVLRLSTLAFSTVILFALSPAAKQNNEQAPCPLVEGLSATEKCHHYSGRRRGLQFPAKSRYVYTNCDYLHVDVEFELARPEQILSTLEDRVIGVSKLYVAYPTAD